MKLSDFCIFRFLYKQMLSLLPHSPQIFWSKVWCHWLLYFLIFVYADALSPSSLPHGSFDLRSGVIGFRDHVLLPWDALGGEMKHILGRHFSKSTWARECLLPSAWSMRWVQNPHDRKWKRIPKSPLTPQEHCCHGHAHTYTHMHTCVCVHTCIRTHACTHSSKTKRRHAES